MWRSLCTCAKACVGSLIWRVKCQHNIFFWHPEFYQFIRNASFSSIVLNPSLIMPNVNMDEHTVNTSLVMPTDRHQLIVM